MKFYIVFKRRDVSFLGYIHNNVGHVYILSGLAINDSRCDRWIPHSFFIGLCYILSLIWDFLLWWGP